MTNSELENLRKHMFATLVILDLQYVHKEEGGEGDMWSDQQTVDGRREAMSRRENQMRGSKVKLSNSEISF